MSNVTNAEFEAAYDAFHAAYTSGGTIRALRAALTAAAKERERSPRTIEDEWIVNAHAQDAEMTLGEIEFLANHSQDKK